MTENLTPGQVVNGHVWNGETFVPLPFEPQPEPEPEPAEARHVFPPRLIPYWTRYKNRYANTWLVLFALQMVAIMASILLGYREPATASPLQATLYDVGFTAVIALVLALVVTLLVAAVPGYEKSD